MSITTGHNQTYYAIQGVANSGVTWVEPDGTIRSAAITDPEVAAWLAGHTPSAAPAPSYDTRYATTIAEGVVLTSTSTSSINDTYPIDSNSIANLEGLYLRIKVGSPLPGGGSTVLFPNLAGTGAHAFTATNIVNYGDAVTTYLFSLTPLQVQANGWPSTNAVTIA